MILSFTIPGPPVPKARARTVQRRGKAHTFTPEATAKYERHVANVARLARYQFDRRSGHGVWLEPWPLDRHYAIAVDAYRVANRGDADNIQKAIGDALNGVLYADDARVVDCRCRLFIDELRPRVEVSIEVVEPPVAVRRAKAKRGRTAA